MLFKGFIDAKFFSERGRGHQLKDLSREKTALPPKNTPFFACPLTFVPAQPRFIVTFFRTCYFFLVGSGSAFY